MRFTCTFTLSSGIFYTFITHFIKKSIFKRKEVDVRAYLCKKTVWPRSFGIDHLIIIYSSLQHFILVPLRRTHIGLVHNSDLVTNLPWKKKNAMSIK